MKTAIIYYSKHGTTERVTHLIGEKLTNKVDYISLKECPRPDIRTYDRIILGTAIYAGSPNRKVTQFCHNNQPLLEQKVIGLFICCMNEEQEAEEMNKAFPEFLQRLSIPKAILGGEFQFDYNEATITDAQKSSTNPEDLKACLEAAVIPEAYKDFLTDAQIVEVKEYTSDVAESAVLKMTPEQMRAKALEGYFVRDAERNLVYCPQGEILRQKSIKRNGMIRYCNKLACKKCKCKCTIQKFKEADFNKDTLIKATEAKRKQLKEENKDKPKTPRMKVVKKVVRYVLHLDQNKMDNRKCLSEHPFGTMKRALGQYYFLLKGKLKVTAEMGLFCLSYNLRRAISLKGVPALIASLG